MTVVLAVKEISAAALTPAEAKKRDAKFGTCKKEKKISKFKLGQNMKVARGPQQSKTLAGMHASQERETVRESRRSFGCLNSNLVLKGTN